MAEGNTFLNALLGAVATTILAFVPFSPLLGGAVAGYLQGGDQSSAITVGALAGLFAAIPLVFVFVVLGSIIPFLPSFGVPGSISALLGIFALLAVFALLAYSVGMSALGGLLGRYVATETDVEI
ncbi:hypothetical protein Hrd1104_07340 [Halorhabdus sp. CBA1104]|uniref:DUF5518 domain-containing protein n=1 Tax=unclassified Halorhabdus TaxID=2621901 RepID=UPI0012B3A4BD|nr:MULTISPECIES: DUF5518 domain-containing protein [unclassified Halorhabdus]QGN07130.1 hypothetical protein Hrd1104_07340 [Halorhabdus sp. CBA1104]